MAEERKKWMEFFHILFIVGLFWAHQSEYRERYGDEFVLYPTIFFVSSFIISFIWFQWMFLSKMYTVYNFDVPEDSSITMRISYRNDFIKDVFTMSGAFWIPLSFYWGWKQGYLVDELIEWLDSFMEIAIYLYRMGGM